MSATTSDDGPQRSLDSGASAFLPKPLHQQTLLNEIGRLLQLDWILFRQPGAHDAS